MFLRPLAIVVAFVVLTGAVVAGIGLLERTVTSIPGWRTAWDRAEILGIRQTDAGLTLTLERAYADLNQVLVGFTVEGLEAAPLPSGIERSKIMWIGELRDPTGRSSYEFAPSAEGAFGIETNLSAVVQTWQGALPPVAGTWELTVTSVGYYGGSLVKPGLGGMKSGECYAANTDPACMSPTANGMVDGTWRFEFELPKPTGTVASVDASDTKGQATVTLTELRVSPTMITAKMALHVANSTGTAGYWAPINGSIRHGGSSYVIEAPTRELEFSAFTGSDEAAGTWEIEIPALEYAIANGEPIRLAGPWTLTATVP
jgi:hypothetical protein